MLADTDGCFPEVKLPGRDADHTYLVPRMCGALPPLRLCLYVNRRVNFIFTFTSFEAFYYLVFSSVLLFPFLRYKSISKNINIKDL